MSYSNELKNRSRKELLEEWFEGDIGYGANDNSLLLELLIDIRDLLKSEQKEIKALREELTKHSQKTD